jgi:hypothetical protein
MSVATSSNSQVSTTTTTSAAAVKPKSEKEQKEIINTFQKLREDQRMIASKAAELQIELKSHEY